jgi:hypothetical protein
MNLSTVKGDVITVHSPLYTDACIGTDVLAVQS